MAADKLLESLYTAERTVRALHQELSELGAPALFPVLESHARKAIADISGDADDAGLRLVRLASLLGTFPTLEPEATQRVDLLVDILDCEVPEARLAAGEVLQGLAEDRFKEVALGVERALTRLPATAAALVELPYLLAEFGDAGAAKLLSKFLSHSEPEVVAAAIEALAEMGDPSAIPALEALEKDNRQVVIEEDDDRISLSMLASEAVELLREANG